MPYPVGIGGDFDLPVVIAVFVVDVAAGFKDIYFATARPATIFGFVRAHPECRPQAAVFGIRHFQPCFKVAVSPRLFVARFDEAGGEVVGFAAPLQPRFVVRTQFERAVADRDVFAGIAVVVLYF